MHETKNVILKKEMNIIRNTNNPGGLKGIDKIIIINLKGSIREQYMRIQLNKLPNLIEGKDYEFINPINFRLDDYNIEDIFKNNIFDKTKLDEYWIDKHTNKKHYFFKNDKNELNQGTISLSLITYYLYLKAFIEDKIFLILEDNVEFERKFVSKYNSFYDDLPQQNWVCLDLHTTNNHGYKPHYQTYYETIKDTIKTEFTIPQYDGNNEWRPKLGNHTLLGTDESGGAKAYVIKPISFLFINKLPIIYSADNLKGSISTIENKGITFVCDLQLIRYTDKYSNDRRNIDANIMTNEYIKLEKHYIENIITTVKKFDDYQEREYKNIVSLMNNKNIIEDIPILYINLNRATERRNKIEEILNNSHLSYERIEAVDGTLFEKNEIKQKYNFRKLSTNEVACALSHIKAIQYAYDNSLDNVLILEDDCSFEYLEFKDKTLRQLMSINNDWDIIQLGIICGEDLYNNFTNILDENLTKSCYYSLGAVAYLVNRRGMEKILNYFSKTKNLKVADEYIYEVTNTYLTVPYFTQHANIFKSDIRDNLDFQDKSKGLWDSCVKNMKI